MKKIFYFLFLALTVQADSFKILHLSFHKGCIGDIEEVCRELNIDVTSWFVLETIDARADFEGIDVGNRIYNMSHERAERVWQRHKEYFNQFDIILTSDTAPLARIFLQNDWQKPLIIWICNRFDYKHDGSDPFPDDEYYNLFKEAAKKKNVKIIPWSPYELVYAQEKDIPISMPVIRPIGKKPAKIENFQSRIPDFIDKKDTIFIYPRVESWTCDAIAQGCAQYGIDTYSGVYAGPQDISEFKGIIYFPYQWGNMALFEDIQWGMIHFVPTPEFLRNFNIFPTYRHYNLSEWYIDENRDLFVYFNSWADLKNKIDTLDFEYMREHIKKRAQIYRNTVIAQWTNVFNEIEAEFFAAEKK